MKVKMGSDMSSELNHKFIWSKCKYRGMSSMLPNNLADTATTSQDDSSLIFMTPIAGRKYYI